VEPKVDPTSFKDIELLASFKTFSAKSTSLALTMASMEEEEKGHLHSPQEWHEPKAFSTLTFFAGILLFTNFDLSTIKKVQTLS